MKLNKWSLLRWFKKNKGKKKRAVIRPLHAEEHKTSQIQHVQWIHTLIAQGAVICYLDKKWLYLFSCCKKSKHLPQAEFEAEGTDRIRVRRAISKSHLVSTIFLGCNHPNQPSKKLNWVSIIEETK
jgi:hypothetical protein